MAALVGGGVGGVGGDSEAGGAADERLVKALPARARRHKCLVVEARRNERRDNAVERVEIKVKAGPGVLRGGAEAVGERDFGGAEVGRGAGAVSGADEGVGFFGAGGQNAARAVVFETAADKVNAVREEGGGEGVAVVALKGAAAEGEAQDARAVNRAAAWETMTGDGFHDADPKMSKVNPDRHNDLSPPAPPCIVVCLLIKETEVNLPPWWSSFVPLIKEMVILFFCGQRPRASVGIARLSRHRECLSRTPTNARGFSPTDPPWWSSFVPLIKEMVILFFCGQRPRASVGIARLSRHRECLSRTPTNARGFSPIRAVMVVRPLIKERWRAKAPPKGGRVKQSP